MHKVEWTSTKIQAFIGQPHMPNGSHAIIDMVGNAVIDNVFFRIEGNTCAHRLQYTIKPLSLHGKVGFCYAVGMISIVVVGKPKQYLREDEEYMLRMRKECTLVVVKDLPGLKQYFEKQGNTEREVFYCVEQGKEYTSMQFAELMQSRLVHGEHPVLCIAPAEGFGDMLTGVPASQRLSLSPLTFPHDLARHILIEQVYRALTINAGHPYHK